MPGRDGTGPMRGGPGTGWGFGNCVASPAPGVSRGGVGGWRGGFGHGGGWRHRFWASGRPGRPGFARWNEPVPPWSAGAEQLELQREVAELESELERLRTRLEEVQGPVTE